MAQKRRRDNEPQDKAETAVAAQEDQAEDLEQDGTDSVVTWLVEDGEVTFDIAEEPDQAELEKIEETVELEDATAVIR
jgi:hypothetical protein